MVLLYYLCVVLANWKSNPLKQRISLGCSIFTIIEAEGIVRERERCYPYGNISFVFEKEYHYML